MTTEFRTEWPTDAPHGTVGVEEEFHLVDPVTGDNLAGIEDVLGNGGTAAEREIVQQIAEIATPVCGTGAELLRNMAERRALLLEAARAAGLEIVAAGTHPSTPPEDLVRTDGSRYAQQESSFPWVWRESNTCGMHVHVGMRDAQAAVATCDALRPYLPMLLALSANSPMWRGEPTGLASIRALLIRMHPRSGMPPVLGSFERYVEIVRGLVEAGPGDGSWIWWFARPHAAHGTLEVRVCDPQSDVRNAHALACFIRALCLRLADGGLARDLREDPAGLLLEDTLWNAIRSGPTGRSVIDRDPSLTFGQQAVDLVDELASDLTPEVARRLRGLAVAPESDMQMEDLAARGSMTDVTLALAGRTATEVEVPRALRRERVHA